ncbi:lipopolysaccharide biosynthesis protein [Clostridium sp.]|uniref:lipopolysaccharide biosynthesis protein n=1 Tax=Clostridium sp. TaxID=1506 RepID=UPI00346465B9
MRTKKAFINSSVNIISFFISFIPNLIIRKVFSDTLGTELLGLNSLYTNIIGWLSIVEMGVGTAIVYSLYKPFAEDNKEKIRGYIRFYGQFYKTIGLIILILGICITPFLNVFFKGEVDIKIVSIGFILFLINTFISYLFSHRLCILNVTQQGYKISIGTTISKLVISILQFIMLKFYPSFILYIFIQLVINLIYYIVINSYVCKEYNWLRQGNEILEPKAKKDLLKNVKAMFLHKVGTLIVFSTDNLVISKFLGLTSLAIYTNYQIVIGALQNVIKMGLGGITASVGNLLAENDRAKAYDIHKKIFFLNFWITSFVVISLYNTLNQFVVIWLGNNNLIDSLTFSVVLINLYFTLMRESVERFQEGSGHFYEDRYAPFCEAAINLSISLILVNYIGLPGVFIGTLISNFAVVFWTKPYVIYKYVFKDKLYKYFEMYFKYTFIGIILLVITNYLTIPVKFSYSISSFIINCLINIVVINGIYLIVFCKTDEFKYYLSMIRRLLTKRL